MSPTNQRQGSQLWASCRTAAHPGRSIMPLPTGVQPTTTTTRDPEPGLGSPAFGGCRRASGPSSLSEPRRNVTVPSGSRFRSASSRTSPALVSPVEPAVTEANFQGSRSAMGNSRSSAADSEDDEEGDSSGTAVKLLVGAALIGGAAAYAYSQIGDDEDAAPAVSASRRVRSRVDNSPRAFWAAHPSGALEPCMRSTTLRRRLMQQLRWNSPWVLSPQLCHAKPGQLLLLMASAVGCERREKLTGCERARPLPGARGRDSAG